MENKDQSGGSSSRSSENPNPCPICLGPVVEDSYLDKCFRTSHSLSLANPFVWLPRKSEKKLGLLLVSYFYNDFLFSFMSWVSLKL